ncbi:hypothetical protein [Pantoea sp. Acro-807]|uniref:hypothetical protein n=1 Tax=Pantoea TaxID=53335 RepID=UPI00141944CD|nr:hypothetical protein [Pantoea sp. Acro-807]NIE70926.1 hypothetical protein [Pantoea sp. Acro-807]
MSSIQDVELLEKLISQHQIYSLYAEHDQDKFSVGENIKLNIKSPQLSLGFVCDSFEDFLRNQKNKKSEPENFYIHNIDFYSGDTPDNPAEPESKFITVEKYRCILSIIELFSKSAVYFDKSKNELIFFSSPALKIPVIYNFNDVQNLNVECAKSLTSLFNDDAHQKNKLEILSESIKNHCGPGDSNLIFESLLRNIDSICTDVSKGYDIYVSKFSYKKIIDELKSAKVEEVGKIHKVFSDIQNQILGIPVSTIIVATQMKPVGESWGIQGVINTFILFSVIVFAALMIMTLVNQWQTLKALNEEIKYKETQAETVYKAIFSDIKGTFDYLNKRITYQGAALITVGVILTICLIFTFAAYSIVSAQPKLL